MRGLSTALLFSAALLVTTVGRGQDEAPSLGDVARQARLQKRKDAQAADSQSKNAQSKDGPTRQGCVRQRHPAEGSPEDHHQR